jgi:hypothetical protein
LAAAFFTTFLAAGFLATAFLTTFLAAGFLAAAFFTTFLVAMVNSSSVGIWNYGFKRIMPSGTITARFAANCQPENPGQTDFLPE